MARFVEEPEVTVYFNHKKEDNDTNQKSDQLGIEETKQAEEPKTISKTDMVTMTLVNMREEPDKNAKVVDTIKGGETVSADSISSNGYTKVKYKNKEGYIAHKYLR